MAYKDSSEIAADQSYSLGEYSFRVERSSGTSPNYDKFEAICTKDGRNARKSIQLPSNTQFSGYYVEANGTTADVYAVVGVPKEGGEGEHTSDLDTSPITQPIPSGSVTCVYESFPEESEKGDIITDVWSGAIAAIYAADSSYRCLFASASPTTVTGTLKTYSKKYGTESTMIITEPVSAAYTHNGKTVYYTTRGVNRIGFKLMSSSPSNVSGYNGSFTNAGATAWTIIYGTSTDPEYEEKTMLIGRFAIELEDAGGVGPGSDWGDPGDWNEDPTTTLHLTVDGALSGRHNDPLNDTSYSYIPADKDTVKDYGCGGDGGNGGGGGGGASSIVVYKFATDKANWKEIVCKPKRHGYGSGGGKGGKGGDGCILIYY